MLCGVIAALHAVGCGLTLYYATPYPSLAGLGFAAYVLGLRHAFDADHIAAVDDTVRYLLQRDKRSIGVGFFFSLGHSTIVLLMASEIALIAMAAASGRALPLPAVLSLPLLFAAGMLVLDTTDGVLMVQAYSWALVDPLRKLFYNIVLTCLSVAVALFIGTAEGLQVLARLLNLHGRLVGILNSLDYGFLGLLIVGLLLVAWGLSALVSRSRRHLARA